MTTWFTSDLHLGHANIIKYTGRPFRNGDELLIQEMDETLIANWNALVRDRDTVYILGDFCFWHPKKTKPEVYFKRLRGRKILIAGNHDKKDTLRLPWAEVYPHGQVYLKINGQKIALNHCSMQVWIDAHKGAWHLFGHSHNTCTPIGRSFDASVDAVAAYRASLREGIKFKRHEDSYKYLQPQDYTLQSLEDVEHRMVKIPHIGVDHHRDR